MRELEISNEQLINSLMSLSENEPICLLDSCGVANLGSHLLIAGIKPIETFEISNENAEETLEFFNEKLSNLDSAFFFTISYDFGLKLEKVKTQFKKEPIFPEPDVYIANFDCLIVYDYDSEKTRLTGNEKRFDEIEKLLKSHIGKENSSLELPTENNSINSNFTRADYLQTIEAIQEKIRCGETYQTNLTQQFVADLPENLTAQHIFSRLRKSHPAPFAAFLKRHSDTVVSISPERFFKIENQTITANPIKGTRPRGATAEIDFKLKNELLNSEKDLAENTMIVDLLRNDLGRICRFGTVSVENLCDLETHPTLFHLVSTVKGVLRDETKFSDVLRAVFPCGSITGAPKIRTMQIIEELETVPRGLSMGAIGYAIQNPKFGIENTFDLSVAIRTMVIKNQKAVFNVGGGIVIDSVPADEYVETLTKAKAVIRALGAELKEIY